MNELTIEPWMLLIPAVLMVCVVILGFSRVRKAVRWRAERRGVERRYGDQRSGDERRSDIRQRHDQTHNAERRDGERRQGERRSGETWKGEYKDIKRRLEEKQRDHRNA